MHDSPELIYAFFPYALLKSYVVQHQQYGIRGLDLVVISTCNIYATQNISQCKIAFFCPQAFLNSDFQCRDDISDRRIGIEKSNGPSSS